MATSQNGGLVLDYGDPRLITTVIPRTNGAKFVGGIAGVDLNLVCMYVGYRWHTEIEPIIAYGCWGHNVRTIRGQTSGYSNHAAGEAFDINAPQHPLGTQTLTARQLDTLRSIGNAVDNVIRFGAFYSGRKDEMHGERNKSYAEVSRVANRIRNGELPNTPDELLSRKPTTNPTPAPAPAPAPSPAPGAPAYPGHLLRNGMYDIADRAIHTLQARLNDHLRVLGQASIAVDGKFGPGTEKAVRLYQWARHGAPYRLSVDGIVGPATWSSLWK